MNTDENATSATVYTFLVPKIAGLLSMGTASNSVSQIFETVRIVSIALRSQNNFQFPNVGVTKQLPNAVALQFSAATTGFTGKSAMHENIAVGATHIAKLKARPSPKSTASDWQNGATSNTAQWFQIIAGYGTICDITVDFQVTPDTRASNSVATVAAATLGQIYYMALDNAYGGAGSSGSVWTPPQDLITIK